MELKERLATLRRSRGYSLRELREHIEHETGEVMAISYLSALERVGRAPSLETLARIAAGYGITLQELLAPVQMGAKPEELRYSASFEAFAAKQSLDAAEKEELWLIQYRGTRPDTELEWQVLYAALKNFSERGRA